MALIRPSYWYPAALSSTSSTFTGDASVILDYPAAVLICAWSLGIEASTVVPVARALIASIWGRTKGNRGSSLLIVTAVLAVMLAITGLLYCVGALLHLQLLGRRPGLGGGVDLFASASVRSLQQQSAVVNQMAAVGMQLMVILADVLLIYRCWIVFHQRKWICAIPCVPFVVSLALSFYGIVAVAQSPPTTNGAPAPKSATQAAAPFIATLSSVSVNIIVTTCISTEIIRSRRKLRKLLGGLGEDSAPSDTYFAVAILVEAALPSALVGVYVPFATFVTRGGIYTSRVAWAVFTALAPQVILVRVLKRRDVLSILQKHEKASSLSSMQFSRSPTSVTCD